MDGAEPELEEVTPVAVGELYHLIGELSQARGVLVMHHTLAAVYERFGAPKLAGEQKEKRELADLDVTVAYTAVKVWIENHLPAPECPHGDCSLGEPPSAT